MIKEAVRLGVLAFLRAYPEEVAGPSLSLRPAHTHTIHWADDFGRGAEMAKVALATACQGLSSRRDDERLAGLALRELSSEISPGELEAALAGLTGAQRDAWGSLVHLLDCLLRTGDPFRAPDADGEGVA